jgi:hypothetical protein
MSSSQAAATGIAAARLCAISFQSRATPSPASLIAMSDASEPPVLPVADSIGEIQVFPRPVVWMAGGLIVALAAFGLVEGVRGAMSGGGAGNGGQVVLPSGDAVSAAAAAPMSSSDQWSALSGPSMSSAASQKPAPAAAKARANTDEDETNTDEDAEAQSATPSEPTTPLVHTAPLRPPPPVQSADQPVPMPESPEPPPPGAAEPEPRY